MSNSAMGENGGELKMLVCYVQTIENTREKDVTMIAPDDEEVDADDAQDEFAGQRFTLRAHFHSYHNTECMQAACRTDTR